MATNSEESLTNVGVDQVQPIVFVQLIIPTNTRVKGISSCEERQSINNENQLAIRIVEAIASTQY